MQVSIPTATLTKVLAAAGLPSPINPVDLKPEGCAVWFYNGTASTIFLEPISPGVSSESDHTQAFPLLAGTRLVLEEPRYGVIVMCAWNAYQASGGSLNLNCGRW